MSAKEAAPAFVCRRVRGVEGARAEVARWEALARDAAEPNLFYEPWFLLPAVALGPAPECFELLLVESEGELVGVFPLHRTRPVAHVPLERLAMYVNDFVSLAVPLVRRDRERDVAQAFVRHLAEERRVLSVGFERIAATGPVFQALLTAMQAASLLVDARRLYTRALFEPRVPIDEYFAARHSRKKQMARGLKKLRELGSVTFDVVDSEVSLARFVDEFLALESSGWKGSEGTALAANASTAAFFREVMKQAFARGRLHAIAMRLDGRAISMNVSLLDAPTSYAYKVAYDETFQKLTPGLVLAVEDARVVTTLPGIRSMDSAGRAANSLLDVLWGERRAMGHFEASTGHATSDLYILGRPAAKWARHRSKDVVALARRGAVLLGSTLADWSFFEW